MYVDRSSERAGRISTIYGHDTAESLHYLFIVLSIGETLAAKVALRLNVGSRVQTGKA